MKYQVSNKKLSMILDEYAEEYKDLLIQATLNQNNEIDIDNISIAELTKIDIEIKERLNNRNRKYRINRISNLICTVGLLYSLIGLLAMIMSMDYKSNNTFIFVGIVCLCCGFFIVIFSIMMKFVYNNKKIMPKKEFELDFEIQLVNKWRIIEGLIYQVTPYNDSLSLKSVISNLEQTKIISKEDNRTLNMLMHYRNAILHNSHKKAMDVNEIEILLEQSQHIIDKLSKLL